MHVCLTFWPKNSRVEAQAFGRAARKGDPGTGSHLIHQLKHALPTTLIIEHVRAVRDDIEGKRLKTLIHTQVPQMLMKDRLFVKVCELRNRLKAIDANPGKLDEFMISGRLNIMG
jgi:hypothetical protein